MGVWVSVVQSLLCVYRGISMNKFTQQEIKVTAIIFFILILISTPNFISSMRRSRNQIRRDDLGSMQRMIDSYYAKYKVFPTSTADGKILACGGPCEYGQDQFYNIGRIPGDPQSAKGVSYVYFSGIDMYQIFIYQEGENEIEYSPLIEARGVKCGTKICNTGRSYNCAVDKSIEECSRMLLAR